MSREERTARNTRAVEPSELQRRLDAVQTGLMDRGWSCAVLTAGSNFLYLAGLRFDAVWSSAARSLVCVVPVAGPLHLLLPGFLAADAREENPGAVVDVYDPPRQPVEEPLLRLLGTMPPGPIGWESGGESRMGLSFDTATAVRAATRNRGAENVSDLMWETRMRKSPAEVSALAAAARAGAAAFEAVFADGVTGRTERELARALAQGALQGGADRAEWVACTSGAGSYHRFVSAPRDRTVEAGDLFWADIGLTSRGYWTDFCRAAVAGPVSSERAHLQEAVIEATAAGVEQCRPSTPVSEVAATIRRRAGQLGIDLLGYGRLGHGIGLSSTEPPSVAEWDPTTLAAGMVVTIEPAVSNASGLYCAEQVVLVTEGDPEILTTAPSRLTEG
jgi:Xaa-Pro aminopeptidase